MSEDLDKSNIKEHFDSLDFSVFTALNDLSLREADAVDVVMEKLTDAMVPGAEVEFTPDEADQVGAFVEDALSEEDAKDSVIDLENIG